MFDASVMSEAEAVWSASAYAYARTGQHEWERVDAQLRVLAKQYVSLEAQLARWLREAQRVKVWKYAG